MILYPISQIIICISLKYYDNNEYHYKKVPTGLLISQLAAHLITAKCTASIRPVYYGGKECTARPTPE